MSFKLHPSMWRALEALAGLIPIDGILPPEVEERRESNRARKRRLREARWERTTPKVEPDPAVLRAQRLGYGYVRPLVRADGLRLAIQQDTNRRPTRRACTTRPPSVDPNGRPIRRSRAR